MNTDQPTTSSSAATDVDIRAKELMAQVEETNRRIAETNKDSREHTDALEARVDESVDTVEKLSADLDRAEKEAGDELDTHMLQQAEDLASE